MNNKGFAITGIIYTTFMLFLLILLSIMGNLRFKNRVLEKTISYYDDTYTISSNVSDSNVTTAPYSGLGLYEYNYSDNASAYLYNVKFCYIYSNKNEGDSLVFDKNNMYFANNDCNIAKTHSTAEFIFNGSISKIGY